MANVDVIFISLNSRIPKGRGDRIFRYQVFSQPFLFGLTKEAQTITVKNEHGLYAQ